MDYSQSPNSTAPNAHDYQQLVSQYGHTDSYNSYAGLAKLSTEQRSMAGESPMGVRVRKGVFDELWVALEGKGGVWVHHITLAPGFEHTELFD
ncbi:MAG: hypothetical protein A3E01_14255 [Gammaproteobacteria bacterium RIFCSPHIGHO2_12_FULL_63_22]|nr:MAG: hypothetical protein A3E01_14255 [Gammaproteobacteria bacterium RIFCSPHIGHO2_12_FULL_63_22]